MAAIHAHLDISGGLSVTALLAACLGGAASAGEALDWTTELQEELLPCAVAGVVRQCSLHLEQKGNSQELSYEISYNDRELSCERLGLLLARAQGLSAWVRDTAKIALDEVNLLGVGDDNGSERAKQILLLVATLWSVEMLSIKSVSCGPVPITMLSENSDKLLVGLPVQVVSTEPAPFVDPIALVLLRILLRVCPSPSEGHSAPRMVLQKITRGTSSTPVKHRTSVALGQLICDNENNINSSIPTADQPSTSHDDSWETHAMVLLETNIDDCTAEHLSFCVERLLHDGAAADAWVTPIVMKKGRSAHILHCLCPEQQKDFLLKIMFRHTTTLGVRVRTVDRVALPRKMVRVQTRWTEHNEGLIRVKIGYLDGNVVSTKAEFDDCRNVSLATGEPIQTIAREAEALAASNASG